MSTLIEAIDLPVVRLPERLDGLRIAHLTDLHARRPRQRLERLALSLAARRLDLVFLTGDYMSKPGDEPAAAEALRRLVSPLKPVLGTFGVFGNHDTLALVDAVQDLPITWLRDQAARVTHEGHPIDLLGLDMLFAQEPDPVALLLHQGEALTDGHGEGGGEGGEADGHAHVRLLLSHDARYVVTAADMGVDLLFAGHTHGGQVRLPGGRPIVNSSQLPLSLTSGILRHRDTLAVVSRGVGESGLPLRLFCPPHVPIYTLRRRSLPGRRSDGVDLIRAW